MDSRLSYCLGGRHYRQTLNPKIYEKRKPKTNKNVKIIRGTCSVCGRNKSQNPTK